MVAESGGLSGLGYGAVPTSGDTSKVFVADTRRRWSPEQKQAIIEGSKTNPVSRVAKKHSLSTTLLFRWRKAEGHPARGRMFHRNPATCYGVTGCDCWGGE